MPFYALSWKWYYSLGYNMIMSDNNLVLPLAAELTFESLLKFNSYWDFVLNTYQILDKQVDRTRKYLIGQTEMSS